MKLSPILIIILLVSILTALMGQGFYQYDEHYQILEFLAYLQGKTDSASLPWEFHHQMRGWIQPVFYYVLLKPFQLIGLLQDSFNQGAFLRIVGAVLGSISQYYLSLEYLKFWERKNKKSFSLFSHRSFLVLTNLAWFLPFLHSRTSSENFSGIMLGLALLFFLRPKKSHFLIGLFCGLSYLFRYQMGFVVAVFWFWQMVIDKEKFKNLAIQAGAIILCFILGVLVDYIGYGEIAFSPWNYFYENLVLGKQAGYGHAPWWKMIEYIFLKGIPPLSFLILAAPLYFALKKPKHFLTGITLSLLFIHMLASGKHIRFLFPVAALIPFMIVELLEDLDFFKKKYSQSFLKFCYGLNILLLTVMIFKAPGVDIGVLKYANRDKDINKVFYQGESPYIKTPGALTFYRDRSMDYLEYPANTEITDSIYYISADRVSGYRRLNKEENCTNLYRQRFSDIYLLFAKDKHRFWSLFRCSSSE